MRPAAALLAVILLAGMCGCRRPDANDMRTERFSAPSRAESSLVEQVSGSSRESSEETASSTESETASSDASVSEEASAPQESLRDLESSASVPVQESREEQPPQSVSEPESTSESESSERGYILSGKPFNGSVFTFDLTTGVLNECPAGERVYPASTVKLLTALLALEILPSDREITPGEEVYLIGENASIAYIRPEHRLTVEMLVEAMLLPSGNDAAYALAGACGRELAGDENLSPQKAVARFVSEMNAYAGRIGCTSSSFTAPDGFAGRDNYSSLRDMALIASKAAENKIIMRYAGLHSANVTYASGHVNSWVNTNKQLDEDSKWYDPNVKGLKTGSLKDNCCIITLYDDGEHRFITGVFGAATDDGRYEDTARLIKLMTGN